MINQFYRPPKSLYDSLTYPIEKSKKIAILMGVMRWAFNNKSITVNGAKFVQQALGIKSYPIHSFLNAKYKGKFFKDGLVLERDNSLGDKVDMNVGIWEEIARCIKIVGGKEVYASYISYDDIKKVLVSFWGWLKTFNGMVEAKKILSFGELIDKADGEAFIRFRTSDGEIMYIDAFEDSRAKTFTLDKDREFSCEACDVGFFPCTYTHPNGQQLCACCSSQLNGVSDGEIHPCSHIECSLIDCEHAIITPSEDIYDELDDRDTPSEEWYQPKGEWQ